MSLNDARVPGEHGNAVFEALSSSSGREMLRTLRRRSTPVTTEDLAAALVAADRTDLSDERSVLIELTHTVVPKFEAAGLVERTEAGVATTDHPALSDPAVDRLVGADAEDVLEALSKRRRRIALSILRARSSPVDRRDLAATVAARERNLPESEVADDAVSKVLASLHHVDLPLLEEANLVRLDDDQQVAYAGHPALDAGDAAVATAVSGD